ncbi:uncharacterized protein LOC119984684 isoform X2 [Tripterygium wilfordii]|uniref:uncharacterized protein LOC119984684 isoform X2 n=1 Tax=Tripterygium wilfordii TaxID=458696 RepID=UPI0018F8430B|nr:uncharacterized protein LOC119984684 isoform X2 [Tripterygium wilfordii]
MTSSTAATWSPSSLQLRLALRRRSCRLSPAVLVRLRERKLDHEVRLLCCVSQKGNERKRRRNGRIAADSADGSFAGWSDSDDGEKSIETQKNKWFGGAVGAGVAGVILVTGLTFAALSMGRRSTSKSKQQMEPLTTQQEALLTTDNETAELEEGGGGSRNLKEDDSSPHNRKGIDKDLATSPASNEASSENRLEMDNENSSVNVVQHTSSGSDAYNNPSDQESLRHESALDDRSAVSDIILKLPENETVDSFVNPGLEHADGSLAAILPESSSEIEEVAVHVRSNNFPNPLNPNTGIQDQLPEPKVEEDSNFPLDSPSSAVHEPSEPEAAIVSVHSELDSVFETVVNNDLESLTSPSSKESIDISKAPQASTENNISSQEFHSVNESGSFRMTGVSGSANPFKNENIINVDDNMYRSKSYFELPAPGNSFSSAGIPAPSVVSAALQVHPGKVLVPAVVDQIQGQALAALQVLKVIEADVQAGDLCTRREYARWLVSASNALSRNTMSKVYPAMYIENVTELAFDDITPEDPDFTSIQGLAEAGLISSKLSRRDFLSSSSENEGPFYFSPESPLSRQDLVSWKMALEKRHLPKADKKILYESSGFVDVDKINPDAWPALVADLATGEQGIIALAFGCTRLFQPDKPVTKAQAAVAIATGEASDIVSEELARIEAESIAENAVAAHSALVAQVEKDVNANFDKELSMEREKVDAVEKMAEEAKQELQRLRAQREEDNIALMREHAAIDSQMEVLSKLRREVEEQLESLMNNKVEISYEKERINKLRQEAENENQEIARLQYQLEVERKALSMARTWAEEEAKRAREQAKALEEARDRWERHGIKVVVGSDLHEESSERVTWLNAGKQFSVKETVSRAENLVEKLRIMANDVKGKSREVIDKIIHKILSLISDLKEWACKTSARANELKHTTILKARESAQDWQRITTELNLAVKEGTKRLAIDCREGVEKISQKFKT